MNDARPSANDLVDSTRAVYDQSVDQFVEAVGTTLNPDFEGTLDRSMLDVFINHVETSGPGPVLDIGCGPGRIAAFLADRGLDVSGIDLSPRMISAAQAAHPAIDWRVGSLTDLGVADACLAAAVCWYSVIHTPDHELPVVWTEIRRALRPDGLVLVAFQSGSGERLERANAFGTNATLVNYRHDVEAIARSLEASGFEIITRAWRAPHFDHESTPQSFLIARLLD